MIFSWVLLSMFTTVAIGFPFLSRSTTTRRQEVWLLSVTAPRRATTARDNSDNNDNDDYNYYSYNNNNDRPRYDADIIKEPINTYKEPSLYDVRKMAPPPPPPPPRMPKKERDEEGLDNYYANYDDDDDAGDDVEMPRTSNGRRRSQTTRSTTTAPLTAPMQQAIDRPLSKYTMIDDDSDDYDEAVEQEEDFLPPGNFWSNPTRRVDSTLPNPAGSSRRRRPPIVQRRRIRRREYRPPKVIRDFYQRLFWYGFDDDDDDDDNDNYTDEDRTMFGGTRGKFNGLVLLDDIKDSNDDRTQRRHRSRQESRDWPEVEHEEEYYDDDAKPVAIESDPYHKDRVNPDPRRRPVGDDYDTSPPRQRRPDQRKSSADNAFGTTPGSDDEYTFEVGRRRRRPLVDEEMPNPYNEQTQTNRRRHRPTNEDDNEQQASRRPRRFFNNNNIEEDIDERPNRRRRSSTYYYYDDDDDPEEPAPSRRRSSSRSGRVTPPEDPPTPILQIILESFFGGSREDPVAAARYNDIIRGGRSTDSSRSSSTPRQRPGYAYPYDRSQRQDKDDENDDENDDDERNRGVDRPDRKTFTGSSPVDPYYDDESPRVPRSKVKKHELVPRSNREEEYDNDNEDDVEVVIDTETVPVEDSVSTNSTKRDKDDGHPTWEERALAVERVPPDTIPAWGPSGDLGINARQKAVQDALEDLQMAENAVRDQERKLRDAKEEIAVLRVDVELERERLLSMMRNTNNSNNNDLPPRQFNEQIRRMESKVQDAARAARLQQKRLEAEQENLHDIRVRHWAVLRCYDPELAGQAIEETAQEIAAKLNLDNNRSSSEVVKDVTAKQ